VSPLTPRELRVIADHVERLTKARVVNTQTGVATTPDLMSVDFPNGYTGTVIWMLGQTSDDPKRRQRIARHARHRDGYQLDVATITTAASDPAADVKYGLRLPVTQEVLCDTGACQHAEHRSPVDSDDARKAIAAIARRGQQNARA
jgi:hypothetical protein